MTENTNQSLARAFEQTRYYMLADEAWHCVTIGAQCNRPLRDWLALHCCGPCAWLITAYNPRAAQTDAQRNDQRDAALKAWLESAGHAFTITDSRALEDDWPAEPGVCLLDMDEGEARALALRFDQVAMVAVPVDGAVQLVWTDPVTNRERNRSADKR